MATVRLGIVAGRAMVRVVVPEYQIEDSVAFTILPGAPARIEVGPVDTAVNIGATLTVRSRVMDRYGNTRREAPTLSVGPGDAVAFEASTGALAGLTMGTQWLFAMHENLVDSTRIRVVPSGRLAVWSSIAREIRLVNLDGSATRTLLTGVASGHGAFPRFDRTRKSVTTHTAFGGEGGTPNTIVVVDTTGGSRREIAPPAGFSFVLAHRQIADDTLLVVGRKNSDDPMSIYHVSANNTITYLAALPDALPTYGAVDISHDGKRVAYTGGSPTLGPDLRVLSLSNLSVVVLYTGTVYAPRWSSQGDRIAYVMPINQCCSPDGFAAVIDADGTNRRTVGSGMLSPGLTWSPDGVYLIGRAVSHEKSLRVIRVSNGEEVLLRFGGPSGAEDYFQPDWR